MLLEVKKDSIGQLIQLPGGGTVPTIDTKNVTTQIAVNNGDTAVLGGIYEENSRNDVAKVPLLGDIPMFGNLFKTTSKEMNKTELLIFITPRVVSESVTAVR
jgi:type IV pilus assembly protein PilQ